METRAHHLLIGAFTLLVIIVAAVSVLWFGQSRLAREWDEYDVVFSEAVTGLIVGGAVQYNGIQVGEVRKLSLDPDDPRRVFARVRVQGGTPIKTDTKAELAITGLTFVAVIQLSGGTPEAPLLSEVAAHDPPRIIAAPSTIQTFVSSGEGIVTVLQETLENVSALLTEENVENIAQVIEDVATITTEVASRDTDIGEAITDLSLASRSLRRSLTQSERVIEKLEELVGSSDELMDGGARDLLASATRFLDSAGVVLEETGPALAKISREDLARIGPTLQELRSAAEAIRELAEAIEDNPESLVRGKATRMREREAK